MNIEIEYKAEIKNTQEIQKNIKSKISKTTLDEICLSQYFLDANLSENFQIDITEIQLLGGSIKFKHTNNQLITVISYTTNKKPNKEQSLIILQETNKIIEDFLGEDGWFADIGENGGYYIKLWDIGKGKPILKILE